MNSKALVVVLLGIFACGKSPVGDRSGAATSDQDQARSADLLTCIEAEVNDPSKATEVGSCIGVLVVRTKGKGIGNGAKDDTELKIDFSTDSETGEFYADEKCSTKVDSGTIEAGQYNVTYFYKDASIGKKITANEGVTATLKISTSSLKTAECSLSMAKTRPELHVGTWLSEPLPSDSSASEVVSEKLILGLENDFHLEQVHKADAGANPAIYTFDLKGTYEVVGETRDFKSPASINFKITASTLTVKNAVSAASFNSVTFCGFEDWMDGEVRSTFDLPASKILPCLRYATRKGMQTYSVVGVEGGKMRFGADSLWQLGSTVFKPELRPTSLATRQYRKQ